MCKFAEICDWNPDCHWKIRRICTQKFYLDRWILQSSRPGNRAQYPNHPYLSAGANWQFLFVCLVHSVYTLYRSLSNAYSKGAVSPWTYAPLKGILYALTHLTLYGPAGDAPLGGTLKYPWWVYSTLKQCTHLDGPAWEAPLGGEEAVAL